MLKKRFKQWRKEYLSWKIWVKKLTWGLIGYRKKMIKYAFGQLKVLLKDSKIKCMIDKETAEYLEK